ncbi:hypothetical protein [Streptomyces sp. PU-14G]|uniref:DUF6895 family protein n=1 Tax=Streptomyces sp. PU-14G TaxID=2800808 RepID=UPI0034DFCD7A
MTAVRADTPPRQDAAECGTALLDTLTGESLEWLERHAGFFHLPQHTTTTADPDLTLKPLGELAELSALIAARHPLPALRARARRLLDHAWRETREGAVFAELVRAEPQATYPVELYGSFARAGLRNAAAEELMRTTTALRGWRVARDDHTRTLAVLNAEARIGLRRHAAFDTVLAHTRLGVLPEPWTLECASAYGLTHDVFHLTDWGRCPGRLPAASAAYLRTWLPAWLESWLEEEVWDLAGELLAVTACLPKASGHPAAWRRLAAARTPDGALPERGEPLPAGAGAGEVFLHCYHSTLVLAFAGTLARTAARGGRAAAQDSEVIA